MTKFDDTKLLWTVEEVEDINCAKNPEVSYWIFEQWKKTLKQEKGNSGSIFLMMIDFAILFSGGGRDTLSLWLLCA